MDREQLIELGKEIAGRLPKPAGLYHLGYDRAVAEVEGFFVSVSESARRYGPLHTRLALGNEAISPSRPRWHRELAREVGYILEEMAGMSPEDAARLIGYVRWAYVADMPRWVFQAHPMSARWDEWIAFTAIHYKAIPPGLRGDWVLPIPEGWKEHRLFLHDDMWYHIIAAPWGTPVPDEWEPFRPEEVVIFPPRPGGEDDDSENSPAGPEEGRWEEFFEES